MNYQNHYDNLIKTRKFRVIDDVYYEKHHIIMKSMGGSDDENNIVHLTAREHFLAHWLLYRIHRNKQTSYAFFAMCFYGNNRKRNSFSSIAYTEAKELHRELIKKLMAGRKLSNEIKEKISNSRKKFLSSLSNGERKELMRKGKYFSTMTFEQRSKRQKKANSSFNHERRSENAKEIWKNLSDETKKIRNEKIRKAKTAYWSSLSFEEKKSRMKKLSKTAAESKKLIENGI